MKKRVIQKILIAVILIASACFGYVEDGSHEAVVVQSRQENHESVADTEQVNAAKEEAAAEEVPVKEPIADLDEAYEMILNHCSQEFIGGYTIDESFLLWIYANYGKETVLSLANEVRNGTQDADIWYELTRKSIHALWPMYCQITGIQSSAFTNVHWKDCAADEQVVLDFTGDINFSEGWGTTEHMDAMPNGIYDCFSEELLAEMNAADIMMINNEFTYSTRGEALAGKDYTFRANPDRVELLKVFGTDIAGLANNHVYDYGPDALLDTLDTLKSADVPYVGAGRNLDEAEQPVYFVANGKKIAIVAATQIERSTNYTKEATDNTPGVLKTLNPDKYIEQIRLAKEQSDYVIAFVHWGTEGNSNYGADQSSLARQFVKAGADVIIGGHTHCLQGMQYIEDVPVIYSLGNFWFSQSTLDTGLAQVMIDKDGNIKCRFLPCIQKNYKTSLVTDETEKQRIFDYVESISAGVTIDDKGYIINTAGE